MSARRCLRRIALVLAITVAAVAIAFTPAFGSMFGEENITLAKILAEIIQANRQLEDISDEAAASVDVAEDLLATYQQVNAGIDELRGYSTDRFLADLKADIYHQYPGFADLAHASDRLGRWESTHTRSPFTAYQAITAVVADLSAPLREDAEAGRVNLDTEMILQGEAAGGFAAATSAEEATRAFDEEMADLVLEAEDASPGKAAQITARAQLMLVAQQSHTLRLLARVVRLDGVDKALRAGARIQARNFAYERQEETARFAEEALSPPRMMRFDPVW